jgi:hypothetical protein
MTDVVGPLGSTSTKLDDAQRQLFRPPLKLLSIHHTRRPHRAFVNRQSLRDL